MTSELLFYSLHPIDIDSKSVERETVQDESDLKAFVANLLDTTLEHDEKRKFLWTANTTEIRSLLGGIADGSTEFDSACDAIANRLHRTERDAQKKHGRITDLQRGTLFQLFFRGENGLTALIAKVFVSRFLDERDYKAHAGLPFEKRILKTCLVDLDESGEVSSVALSDATGRIAEFWWKDFLELEEQTTDEFNTRTAFAAMESLLGRKLKQDFKADYSHLRNNLVHYFQNRTTYSHKDMLSHVFGRYRPVVANFDLQNLRDEAEKLPERKGFDPTFKIPEGVLDKRCRRVVSLTDEIDLQIKDAIDEDAILAANTRDGRRGVFIRSAVGYETFQPTSAKIPTITTVLQNQTQKKITKHLTEGAGN